MDLEPASKKRTDRIVREKVELLWESGPTYYSQANLSLPFYLVGGGVSGGIGIAYDPEDGQISFGLPYGGYNGIDGGFSGVIGISNTDEPDNLWKPNAVQNTALGLGVNLKALDDGGAIGLIFGPRAAILAVSDPDAPSGDAVDLFR